MFPVSGREVGERQQRLATIEQALDRLAVFDGPILDEGAERLAIKKRAVTSFAGPDWPP
jgi:hypothetical protein